mgnify:CR=1 FL=1
MRRYKNNTVEIGKLEVYLGDLAIKNNWDIPIISNCGKGKRVAIVGGGPAGLTCGAFLVRNGFDVTIYEKHENLGGILYYGIPEFRLPKKVLKETINKILELGIHVRTNCELGKDIFIEELESKYDAIYLSFGANKPIKMNIPGENLKGVYGANELLESNLQPDYKERKVSVIGGGNVAIDAARTIKKLGAKEVTIIYRRAEEQMPANHKEINAAKKDGVKFLYQTNIVKILGKEQVEKIECVKTELIKKENEGKLKIDFSEIDTKGLNQNEIETVQKQAIVEALAQNYGLKYIDENGEEQLYNLNSKIGSLIRDGVEEYNGEIFNDENQDFYDDGNANLNNFINRIYETCKNQNGKIELNCPDINTSVLSEEEFSDDNAAKEFLMQETGTISTSSLFVTQESASLEDAPSTIDVLGYIQYGSEGNSLKDEIQGAIAKELASTEYADMPFEEALKKASENANSLIVASEFYSTEKNPQDQAIEDDDIYFHNDEEASSNHSAVENKTDNSFDKNSILDNC